MKEMSYEEMLRFLENEGTDHIAYYHYTRWSSFAKMMQKVKLSDGEHRLLYLTNASWTNDGIEARWPNNVYMVCFSHSRYEDVAMWLNYGKYAADAVRVKFDRASIARWRESAWPNGCVYGVEGDDDNPQYVPCPCSTQYVRLSAVAYVIPSKHWVVEQDGIEDSDEELIVQDGNVEWGRSFFKVFKEREGYDWVDRVYDGISLEGIDPVFKKRGWAYEREVRIIVKINGERQFKRIAIPFDEPLDELERCMRMTQEQREREVWLGTTKVWDKRFPLFQSGPWYDEGRRYAPVCGFDLGNAFRSEYSDEIKILRRA